LPEDFFQIRQICCKNPPERIGQIRQKSARNREPFRTFCTPKGSFCFVLVRFWQYLRSSPREIFFSSKNILQKKIKKYMVKKKLTARKNLNKVAFC
jgi:hypothetical protein